MDFDVKGNLASVERSVAFLEKEARPASAVTLSRTYDTAIEDLWDALTNLKRIPRWFAPVSGDLRLGGRYAIEGNASGTVAECERLSHFKLTWEFAGDVSWVEMRISVEDAKPRLTLTHTALLSPHWDEYGAGAVGWGGRWAFSGWRFTWQSRMPPSPTKWSSQLHGMVGRSSMAAARVGCRQP